MGRRLTPPSCRSRTAYQTESAPTRWGADSESVAANALLCRRCNLAGVVERDLLVGAAQIFVRIHRNLVDAHLIVQVRTGRAARLANVADHLAAGHMLAGHNRH